MTKEECGLIDKCPDNPCCAYGCDHYETCWGEIPASKEEIVEQIAHLKSLLPGITDRHEFSGTEEVIGRLEGKLEAIEEDTDGEKREERDS